MQSTSPDPLESYQRKAAEDGWARGIASFEANGVV